MNKNLAQYSPLRWLIFFCLLLVNVALFAQFTEGTYYKNDGEKVPNHDSLIRAKLADSLSSSYFVITYPIDGAVTTFAPQFIKAWLEIKELNRPLEDVIVVFSNEGGIQLKDMDVFIKDILKQKPEEIRYIVDTKLYSALNGPGLLVRSLYYFRGNLIHTSLPKVQNLNSAAIPQEQINIEALPPIKITDTLQSLIRITDYTSSFDGPNILIHGQVRDAVYQLNTETGHLSKVFALSDFYSPLEVFCSLFAKDDTALCNFATRHHPILVERNRQTLKIEKVHYEPGSISGFFVSEVFIPSSKKETYYNDLNQKLTLEKGDPSLEGFQGFFRYSLATKQLQLYTVEQTRYRGQFVLIAPNADFIYLDSNTLLCDLVHDNMRSGKPLLCILKIVGNKLSVQSVMPPNTVREIEEKADFGNLQSFYFSLNDVNYYCRDVSPEIYQAGQPVSVGSFYGDMTPPYPKETYRQYAEDTVTDKINFHLHGLGVCCDGEYVVCYYRYKNSNILEIKNKEFKTLDLIDMSTVPGFYNYYANEYHGHFNLLITKDTLHFIYQEKGSLWLASYAISKKNSK